MSATNCECCLISDSVTTRATPILAYTDPNPISEVVRGQPLQVRVTLRNKSASATGKIYFSGRAGRGGLAGTSAPLTEYLGPGESVTLQTRDSIYATASESLLVLGVILETMTGSD